MGNMIDLDITLFIQLANFIITIVVLNFLLIKPVRDQIAARNALLADYAGEAERFNSHASQKLVAYEQALADARATAAQVRDAKKAEGLNQEQEIIARAHTEAQAFLQASRAEVAKESKAAMKALLSQVNGFAGQAVAKILG